MFSSWKCAQGDLMKQRKVRTHTVFFLRLFPCALKRKFPNFLSRARFGRALGTEACLT